MNALLIEGVLAAIQRHFASEQIDDFVIIIAPSGVPQKVQVAAVGGGAVVVIPPASAHVDGIVAIPDHPGTVVCQCVQAYRDIAVGFWFGDDAQTTIRHVEQTAIGPDLRVQQRFAGIDRDGGETAICNRNTAYAVVGCCTCDTGIADVQPAIAVGHLRRVAAERAVDCVVRDHAAVHVKDDHPVVQAVVAVDESAIGRYGCRVPIVVGEPAVARRVPKVDRCKLVQPNDVFDALKPGVLVLGRQVIDHASAIELAAFPVAQ